MTPIKRAYKETDFIKIRDFLQKTYSQSSDHYNWFIERWNFCRYFVQPMFGTVSAWSQKVGLWVDEEDNILSVVHSEGENKGEAFIQICSRVYSHECLKDIIDYAESTLAYEKENERHIYLRVNPERTQIKELLKNRQYTVESWAEDKAVMDLDDNFLVQLPEGFYISDGHRVDHHKKGLAHSRAFGHSNSKTPEGYRKSVAGYKTMPHAPDYQPALDLYVLDPHGDVASFATIWYDATNRMGILEPVGTIPKYRRKGLGKAVIYEGINRIKALGARKMYVGSSQDFYLSIGFSIAFRDDVWHKKWVIS